MTVKYELSYQLLRAFKNNLKEIIKMAMYTKKELKEHRKNGLQLTDAENESYGADEATLKSLWREVPMTPEEYEGYLKTRTWDESTKEYHRTLFKGTVYFSKEGTIRYEKPW